MRKVLFKKWIEGVEALGGTEGAHMYYGRYYEAGTACYSEMINEGFFHGFMYDFGAYGEPYANIEHNGEMVYIEADKFKFIDSPEDEQLAEFTKAAMQGLLANNTHFSILALAEKDGGESMAVAIAEDAYELAQCMIAELKNKHKT